MSDTSRQKAQRNSLATASTADSNDNPWLSREQVRQIAEAMFRDSPVDVIKRNHAELSRLYASMVLIQKKSEEDRLTPQQRQIVDTRVHSNMMQAIYERMRPEVRIRVEEQNNVERGNDREPNR
jgi:hypothetical protein